MEQCLKIVYNFVEKPCHYKGIVAIINKHDIHRNPTQKISEVQP